MRAIIDSFNKITGLRVDLFISAYTSFVDNDLGRIVNFYSGIEPSPDRNAFKSLKTITSQSNALNDSIIKNSRRLNVPEYWEIVELLEDVRSTIDTSANAPRWSRSTSANSDINISPEIVEILPQMNTIEEMASRAGYVDPNNSWVNIALRNNLDEESYTILGGNALKINVIGSKGSQIEDVVDRISGKNMMGKDIKAVYEYAENDLVTVIEEACLSQMYDIAIGVVRGDIPEFPNIGISTVGTGNMATFSYPIILRQLHRVFHRDSSVESISIVKFNISGDNIVMDIAIESKFGNITKKGVII